MHVLALAKPDIPVPVSDYNNRPELDTATGIGHPLHHGNIKNLIFQIGKEHIDNLWFLDRSSTLKYLVDIFYLSRCDELPKTGSGKVLKRELRAPFWAGRDSKV